MAKAKAKRSQIGYSVMPHLPVYVHTKEDLEAWVEMLKQFFASKPKRIRRRRVAKGHLTADQVAEACGVDVETVYGWIHAGELRAINRAKSKTTRQPRWMVADGDLAAFLATRATHQPPTRRRRPRSDDGVIEFYK